MPSDIHVNTGESVGLSLRAERLSLFVRSSGRAVKTALIDGGAHG
jgi:multiple sugar transport system ATP-binding protein